MSVWSLSVTNASIALINDLLTLCTNNPAKTYLLKDSNGNTRKRSEICSMLTIKTQGRRHWCRSDIFYWQL